MKINRLTLRPSSFLPLLLLGAISVPGNRQLVKATAADASVPISQEGKPISTQTQTFVPTDCIDDHGKPTYRLSPLCLYDMILNFNGNDENISASLNKEALQ